MHKHVRFFYSFDYPQLNSSSGSQIILSVDYLAVVKFSSQKIRKIHVEVLIQ
jgi:hypothetical protein